MRVMMALVMMVVCSASAAMAEERITCPESVDVASQDLVKKVPDWRYFSDTENTTYKLDAISVGKGKKPVTSLTADKGNEEMSEWYLRDNGKEQYWVLCSYTHTSIKLKRTLSDKFKTCRVAFEKDDKKPGMQPMMHKFTCE